MKLIKRVKKEKPNLRPRLALSIKGYNIERALNLLCKKGVTFLLIEKKDIKNANIEIDPSNKNLVINFLAEKKIEVVQQNGKGIYRFVKFFLKRFGLLIGFFVFFICFVIMSNFCLKVEISGTERILNQEIMSFLNENGVGGFSAISKIDTKEVEKLIKQNFDDVSLVSVIKKGNSILINIKEKIYSEDYAVGDNILPLVSTADGIITELNLVQGTALVKVGDIVKIGQPLVAPFTTDATGKQIPIVPKALVKANTWQTATSTHFNSKMVIQRTGKVLKNRQTSFLGIKIYSTNNEIEFKDYETEVKEGYLSNFIIPIKYVETFYYETKCDIIKLDFETVKEQKIEEARKLALTGVDKTQIKNEKISIASQEGKTVVTCTLTLEREITK